MLPELDMEQSYIHDTITNPVLPSYQTNYKFVNGLVGNDEINGSIENMTTLKDSTDVLFNDIVDSKQTVLQTNGVPQNPVQTVDYSMESNSEYTKNGIMMPNNQHKPLETILIPITSIEPMNSQHQSADAQPNLIVADVRKVKNKRTKQVKEKNTTTTNTKKRKANGAKAKATTESANVPFLTFPPKNESIEQINALQSDNSTIFPMAITGYDNSNNDNLLSTDNSWAAFNVPTSFNISSVNLNTSVTESENTLVHISQITQADLLNCLYQEPQPTVTTEQINCIEPNVSENLIDTNYQQYCITDANESKDESHQLIVCNAGILAETVSEDWNNDCHAIVRSSSILPQVESEKTTEIDSINAAGTDLVMYDGYGSFILQK